MKILHFKTTMRLEEGGVVKAVLDLVRMSADSDQVGLATLDSSGVPDDWDSLDSITVHELDGHPGKGGSLTKPQMVAMEQLVSQYDLVHLHAMWMTANPQIAKICKRLGKPYVLSVHGMLDDWCMSQRKLKKLIYMNTWGRNLLRDAACVHCTARAELDQASAWFDQTKGEVIPLPFDLGEYRDLPGTELCYEHFDQLDRSKPKVLFLSRVHYKKGVDRLIKASAILAQRGVEHQLVLAGTGDEAYENEMKTLAAAEGIRESAYFLGFASGAPKISLIQACDLFALPTSQENFGFVFFEALASGTPVVTTKGTDTWPEIEQSGGGKIVDNTPEAFADAIEELLSRPEQVGTMGQEGRDWALSAFELERIANDYHSLYVKVSGASA